MKKLKKHLWVTERQNEKLKYLKNELGLNYSEIIRAIIDKDFIYINLYNKILHELNKQGNNLNQITRHVNTEKTLDNKILYEIEQIKLQQELIKTELKNYDN